MSETKKAFEALQRQLKRHERTDLYAATRLGISKKHFSECLRGVSGASDELIEKVHELTLMLKYAETFKLERMR